EAAVQGIGQLVGLFNLRVAQARQAEKFTSLRALSPALVVARGGIRVLLAGIQGDELMAAELEDDRRHLERGKVNPQRMILLAVQRGELVEQTRLGAGPLVLDP